MLLLSPTARAFELRGDKQMKRLLADQNERERAEDDSRLHCGTCGHSITSRTESTSVNGSHGHTFTNPHGFVFRIGCFGAAPGCIATGDPTEAWTWFPGFRWRLALCRHCRAHLGWSYRSGVGDGFFGLILDRLISPS